MIHSRSPSRVVDLYGCANCKTLTTLLDVEECQCDREQGAHREPFHSRSKETNMHVSLMEIAHVPLFQLSR